MISSLGRCFAPAWYVAKRILLAALVVGLIDVLPIAKAGLSLASLAKGLIAVPVGVAIALDLRPRNRVAFFLFAGLTALLGAFVASGYFQNDAACDIAIIALFAVGAWITVPFAIASDRRVEPKQNVVFTRPHATVGSAPMGVGFAAIVALGLAVVAGRAGVLPALPPADAVFDAALGAPAMYLIAERFAGWRAGLGAAVLWIFSGIRLDFATQHDVALQPTAVVPVVVVAAFALHARAKLRSWGFGLALAVLFVPLVVYWPLLGLSAALATALVFWTEGFAAEATWVCGAFLVAAVATVSATAATQVPALAMQTAIADPAQALAACASGCDGGLPWEFFYPSAYGGAYAGLLAHVLTGSLHWGNYQYYAISPGWSQLGLAVIGIATVFRSNVRLVRATAIAVGCGMFLALPSHYLGYSLPSFVHILTEVAPGFQFGAQLTLSSALFVALLGGLGLGHLSRAPANRAMLGLTVAAAALLLDVAFLPPARQVAETFERATRQIPASDGPIAFYPFLTASDGAEFYELAKSAKRRSFVLFNDDVGAPPAIRDLSAYDTLPQLRRAGVRLIVVSLDDYSRRREILREAHILLPADRREATKSWSVPDASQLGAARVVRTDADGVLVLALDATMNLR